MLRLSVSVCVASFFFYFSTLYSLFFCHHGSDQSSHQLNTYLCECRMDDWRREHSYMCDTFNCIQPHTQHWVCATWIQNNRKAFFCLSGLLETTSFRASRLDIADNLPKRSQSFQRKRARERERRFILSSIKTIYSYSYSYTSSNEGIKINPMHIVPFWLSFICYKICFVLRHFSYYFFYLHLLLDAVLYIFFIYLFFFYSEATFSCWLSRILWFRIASYPHFRVVSMLNAHATWR